ncbi:hypothetical protein AMAG_04913 [Allomyces macrogynus ATCC 38327]|uniref:EGF-like domain-containing protein n=1 Tax=Allomyces macrogynus (strain ATCC 38327) TaxID=578462 RepID=A0A0L0S684_ALLM3|nr:hypothetical protein AMAG_04913 [Allomyces macrogynus ATCC 38327]|eukprot:KNE58093.1 hypothetical protein AMAG_04913 [Allomyces macrogynus ATCC 38327]
MERSTFSRNSAKRGGAWFMRQLEDEWRLEVADLMYFGKVPNNHAASLHELKIVTIQLLARDAFGQPYQYGGGEQVPVERAVADQFNLMGELTKAIGTGSTNWTGLVAYERSGTYLLSCFPDVNLVTEVPWVNITILPCNAPVQLEFTTPLGPYYPVCSTVACPQGCIHGKCTAVGQCECNHGYEGFACQFPIDQLDSFEWVLASLPYLATIGACDGLLANAQAVLPPRTPLFRSMTQQTTRPRPRCSSSVRSLM